MKKIISVLLALCLCISMLPGTAMAAEVKDDAAGDIIQGNSSENGNPDKPLSRDEILRNIIPDYPVNSSVMQKEQFDALGAWLISYARNPSLKSTFDAIMMEVIDADLVPVKNEEAGVDYEKVVPVRKPALRNLSYNGKISAAAAVGDYLVAYARNPSLREVFYEQTEAFGLTQKIKKHGEELNPDGNNSQKTHKFIRQDVRSEAVQIGKADALGSLLIAYARNPSLKEDFLEIFTEAFGENTGNCTVSPAVRAAYIRSTGALLVAYARNPNYKADFFELFNRFSPVSYEELITKDLNTTEVQAAQMDVLGCLLISYARNPSLENQLMEIYRNAAPEKDAPLVPIEKREPAVQAAAARVAGLLTISYARNPSLWQNFTNKFMSLEGLTREDENGKFNLVKLDTSLPEVQEARMETISMLEIAYARNPSMRATLESIIVRTVGYYADVKDPDSLRSRACHSEVLNGLMIGYARNPSLFEQFMNYFQYNTVNPLPMGEGYDIDFENNTITIHEGYDIFYENQANNNSYDNYIKIENGADLNEYKHKVLYIVKKTDQSKTDEIHRVGYLNVPEVWTEAPANAPEVKSKSYSRVTLEPVEPLTDPVNMPQYSCDGGRTWQSDNEFGNLKSNTSYQFTVRYGGGYPYSDCVNGYEPSSDFIEASSPSPAGPSVEVVTNSIPSRPAPEEPEKNVTQNKDGSVTTAEKYPDGKTISVTKSKDGGEIKIVTEKNGDRIIQASPSKEGKETAVVIPADQAGRNQVAAIVYPDGTEKVIKKSVTDENGMHFTVDSNVEIRLINNSRKFSDTENHWAEDAIDYVTSHEIFQGTSEGIFEPDAAMSRGMLAKVLHNLEENPKSGNNIFTDVEEGMWYTDAISWAAEKGIVNGYGDRFDPDGILTRQQLAVMLWRYAGKPEASPFKTEFSDADKVGEYAVKALSWAVENGIIKGTGSGMLDPEGNTTRAQVAAMLQRYQMMMF